jgi:sugar phosphate isomerase/epimerase
MSGQGRGHVGRSRFFINTYRPDCGDLARRWGIGLEIIDFSIATRMDDFAAWDGAVRQHVAGVDRLMLHAPYHDLAPASIDPEIRGVTMHRFEQALATAAAYGVNGVVYHSGYVPRAYLPRDWVASSAAFWRGFLADKPVGLRLFIENVADDRPELLRDLIDALDDPRVAVCLDVGHANINSAIPLSQWIPALTSRIGHVHLNNNDGAADRHWRLDRGNIDMAETLALLSEHSPHATYTIEAAEEEECLRWLETRGWV